MPPIAANAPPDSDTILDNCSSCMFARPVAIIISSIWLLKLTPERVNPCHTPM